MQSMTGFTEHAFSVEGNEMHIIMRSVNSRFFEISFSQAAHLPMQWLHDFEAMAKKVCQRGKVHVQFKTSALASEKYRLNHSALKDYQSAAKDLSDYTSHATLANFATDILVLPGVIEVQEQTFERDYKEAFYRAFEEALLALQKDCLREGQYLKNTLLAQLDALDIFLQNLLPLTTRLEAEYMHRLKKRFETMINESFDEGRILQEVAVFAEKTTIQEECDRLASHCASCREFLVLEDQLIGKKVDFLAQEMQREVNTIGTKLRDAHSDILVVRAKETIENIREQAQNIK